MSSGNCNITANSNEINPSLHRPGTIDRRHSLGESVIGTEAFRTSSLSKSHTSFEEYIYWAQLTRANENDEDPSSKYTIFGWDVRRFGRLTSKSPSSGSSCFTDTQAQGNRGRERQRRMLEPQSPPGDLNVSLAISGRPRSEGLIPISSEEYERASRAARTASWSAMFYLMTMDILGPFSVPWAFAALGYGPSIAIYTSLWVLATYGGFMLWKMFLGLDSDRYPVKTYADIAFRVYGSVARGVISLLQSTQLLFNVGIILLINAISLEQIITGSGRGNVCFIVLVLVWTLAGMTCGQIRTLRRLAWVANFAIWLNAFSIFAIMGVVANSGVLAAAAQKANASFRISPNEPISTSAGIRPGLPFTVPITGVMSAVYSFGGAILFVEFLSEMARPFDFWKALICAEAFIYALYLLFGLFVYSHQGQYTINPTYQGLAPYGWHAAINAIQLVTSCVATLLYANIGLKVIYNSVLVSLFRTPHLATRGGKIIWAVLVPLYWSLAFVIATAIPQVTNLAGLVAAMCILQFSFTFPPVLMVGYNVQKDSMLPGDGWDPVHGAVIRQDGGWRRLWRGFKHKGVVNFCNSILGLAGLSLAVLAMYSAIKQIVQYFALGVGTSFSCKSPYG